MKVKVISRSEEEFTRERTSDLRKVQRNYDPLQHQFEKAELVQIVGFSFTTVFSLLSC